MQVRVRLFAALRERAGEDIVELELGDDARVDDALRSLSALTGDMPVVMAVNRHYAGRDTSLKEGDELALIPPVSGGASPPRGADRARHTRVTREPLALEPLVELVRDAHAGAIVTFLGVTRQVDELHYEAYHDMAESQMAEIVQQAIDRHGLCAAAAEHRIGVVPLSEPSVAVAAAAPHRDAAFAGAREIIDEIKTRVPVWKKEEGEWVKGTTPKPA